LALIGLRSGPGTNAVTTFVPWHKPQRREVAGAGSVVFKEEMIDVGFGKEPLSDGLA